MPTTQAEFRTRLEVLVNRFKTNAAEYFSTDYSEAQARRQLIDPLFAALGWDLEDQQGLGPSRCEVWMEKGETTGKPDYNFRINAQTKFFAEAKAPHVKLSGPHILQAKRYAWNHADVSFAVLTDFEEFHLYDASLKPDPEHPDLGLIFQYRYDEYLTDAALADLWKLSRDEVAAGSLDKLLKQDAASRRWRVPVDKAFLADLTDWRELLAKDAFKHNSDLDVRALNEAVQVLLDRLIFVRIAEDRRIIQADTLKKLVERWSEGKYHSLRAMLTSLFETINEDLNGEVFKPNAALDEAAFDDALTARIIHGLTDGPYDFAVIGVELLGSIYERYLGKTIRVTAKRAIVEDKPEVRKAGGVYYTPKYIVDYIVEQTVGKLIEGKTPAQIAKLRIADPACGSGSFLLAAYQKLIDYHVAYYAGHPKEARQGELFPFLIDAGQAGQRLSIEKKAEILTNNIFGVDIDPQAVEITMMSLYIKALEGETTLPHKHGLLPTLANNIKCGNSLIGTDYFAGQLMPDAEEWERVKPFDWESEFPQVFHSSPRGTRRGAGDEGGFDCVIGNPPYIRVGNIEEVLRPYLYQKYSVTYRFDIYIVFIQRAFELLSRSGLLGFIVPNKFFTADYGTTLRRYLSSQNAITRLVDFGDNQVFDGATTYTCLLFLSRTPQTDLTYWPATVGESGMALDSASAISIRTDRLSDTPWAFLDDTKVNLADHLKMFPPLGTFCDIARGLETGWDDVFLLIAVSEGVPKKYLMVKSAAEPTPFKIEAGAVRPVVKGAVDVRRYFIENSKRYVLFPYRHENGEPYCIDENTFKTDYPLTWQYLLRHAKDLRKRKGEKWFAFRRRNYNLRDGIERLLVPSIAQYVSFVCDPDGHYQFVGSGGGGGGGYGIALKPGTPFSIHYLLGVLNSRLLDWYAKLVNSRFGSGYYSFNRQYIEPLPVRPVDFSDLADKARHDRMVSLVERMLELHKRLASARTSADREMYQHQIEATDCQIDTLVYELYGLTEDEIEIIEAS